MCVGGVHSNSEAYLKFVVFHADLFSLGYLALKHFLCRTEDGYNMLPPSHFVPATVAKRTSWGIRSRRRTFSAFRYGGDDGVINYHFILSYTTTTLKLEHRHVQKSSFKLYSMSSMLKHLSHSDPPKNTRTRAVVKDL